MECSTHARVIGIHIRALDPGLAWRGPWADNWAVEVQVAGSEAADFLLNHLPSDGCWVFDGSVQVSMRVASEEAGDRHLDTVESNFLDEMASLA